MNKKVHPLHYITLIFNLTSFSFLESHPPQNITYSYDESDNLILSWNHPHKTNGPLKEFIVLMQSLNGISLKKTIKVDNDKYQYTLYVSFKLDKIIQGFIFKFYRLVKMISHRIRSTTSQYTE